MALYNAHRSIGKEGFKARIKYLWHDYASGNGGENMKLDWLRCDECEIVFYVEKGKKVFSCPNCRTKGWDALA